jgi:hypothetical protein
VKDPRAEARNRYSGKTGKKTSSKVTPSSGSPSAATTATGSTTGTVPPQVVRIAKQKSTKSGYPIRLVDSGSLPWERKSGFTGEHVEITPTIPELVDLVRAIDSDPVAQEALSKFLLVLEQANVMKILHDA